MTMSVRKAYDDMNFGLAPESDAQARAWISNRGGRFGHFVNGSWQRGRSYFPVISPVNGERIAQLSRGTPGDVDAAVSAAGAAQTDWAALSCHARAKYLYAIARLVQKHARLFATLESLDNGKPIRESRDIDIPLVARHFYYHAGQAELRDETHPNHVPVGVVGQVCLLYTSDAADE